MSYQIGFSEEKEDKIIEMYLSGKDQVVIAKHFNTYNTSIRRVLLRRNIKILSKSERDRLITPTFFNNYSDINIQYWLGVIASDGCITRNRLVFEAKDKEWVENFRDFLNPKINITITQPKRGNTLYRMSCGVKGLKEELFKYGIIPNKSLVLEWKMPITNHFLRGIFDGDGCITLTSKTKYALISICSGSKIFLEQIQIFLEEKDIHSVISTEIKDRKNPLYYLSIHNLKDKQKMYYLLYDNTNFFLKRKEKKFATVLGQSYLKEANRKVQLNENGKITNYSSISALGRYLNIDHRKIGYWLQKNLILKKGYDAKYL